jgi:hypothetical protein
MKTIAAYAAEIRKDWKNVNFAAKPYLDAMLYLDTMADRYIAEPAPMIVGYFLANAGGWKGPVAKAVKADLKAMIKGKK